MAQTYSFPGPTGLTTTTDGRKDIAGLITRDGAGNARAGVFYRSSSPIVTARSDMKVDVAAFEAAAVQYGGPILLANDGTVQVTIATAPVANSRIDVVYVKQNESAAPGVDADNSKVLGAVTGTPAASPVKPAIPTGALELATVQVPAGALATNAGGVTITQTNQYTAAAGAPVAFRTRSDMNQWTAAAPGQQAIVFADTGMPIGRYEWTGLAWANPGLIIAAAARSGVTVNMGNTWNLLTTAAWWTTVQNNGFNTFDGTWVAPINGWYDITAGLFLTTSANYIITVSKNNTSASDAGAIMRGQANGFANEGAPTVQKIAHLNAGDVLRLLCYSSATAAWATQTDGSWFVVRLIAAD